MLSLRLKSILVLATLLAWGIEPIAALGTDDGGISLVRGAEPVASVVVLQEQPDHLLRLSAKVITTTVKRWSGTDLAVRQTAASKSKWPAGSSIILTTLEDLRVLDPSVEDSYPAVLAVNFVDEHGFACVPMEQAGNRHLLVVGRTSRGVFNGATWLRDFCIDGTRQDLTLETKTVLRTPQMTARGTYCLAIYGVMPQYTVEDWEKVFESFARDGMDRVYFWVSGMFPSQKFPQTFDRDASTNTVIRTVDQIRDVIRKAHDLGLKLYLGSGAFAWSTAAYLGEGLSKGGCPSYPELRQRHKDYFMEMIDALPEADGFFFELRDEHGECKCDVCQTSIDEFGSKQYGQGEISFVQEFARDVWLKHPHVNFSVNVGYHVHKDDVAFYRVIGKMRDPRFEWLDCRNSWVYPSEMGEPLPGVYFSPRMIHWDPFYSGPLDRMIQMADKTARVGYCGYVPAFEPGFNTADYYNHQVPYPTDVLNYAVSGFVYREVTWEPIVAAREIRQRIQKRFFGRDAPNQLGEDLFFLRDWITANSRTITKYSQDWINYGGKRIPHPVMADEVAKLLEASADDPALPQLLNAVKGLKVIRDEGLPKLAEIEERINQTKRWSPKTLETIEQMQSLINDTRKHFSLVAPDATVLDDYAVKLEAKLEKQETLAE